MRTSVCPKCGASYELHPLNPESQEICPACRNQASWGTIKQELARAAKGDLKHSTPATLRLAVQQHSAKTRSVFAPRVEPVLLAHNVNSPFGRTAVANSASGTVWGGAIGSERKLATVNFVSPALQDSAASKARVTDLSGTAMPVEIAQVPVLSALAAAKNMPEVKPGFIAQAESANTKRNNTAGASAGFNFAPLQLLGQNAGNGAGIATMPAKKPAMIEMPNTCGG